MRIPITCILVAVLAVSIFSTHPCQAAETVFANVDMAKTRRVFRVLVRPSSSSTSQATVAWPADRAAPAGHTGPLCQLLGNTLLTNALISAKLLA
jgi:hypothetical protein